MTDLKPEDLVERLTRDLGLSDPDGPPGCRASINGKQATLVLSADLRSLLADRARMEKAAALLERVVIYQIEGEDRIHISVAGQHLEGFDPNSHEAQALLRFDAEQRGLRKGASQ